ncbi:unnamed protein product [Bursaphelenchus okinawaensis]|uniref:Uncharacterized protein n=1 Tax=Bursaphelenchus okinawaensis TaxID=465554 RepID=A0A811K3S3_9BILA|nr:unnamed protein product [Bursaphelenchus okinawaensis]CAG9091637.1 unnamed protein product [Bursaphelenchus okinawaensis]
MPNNLERILDSYKESGEQYDPEDTVDKCLLYSDMRCIILALLERRFTDLGIKGRIEEYCAQIDRDYGKKHSFLTLRKKVEEKKDFLIPEPLQMEVMRMAADFVDRFYPPRNGHATFLSSRVNGRCSSSQSASSNSP